MPDIAPFVQRRARLLEQMGAGVAVIPTAPERPRNRDTHYPYRWDSYFHYLTGFPEPEAVLVLCAGEAPKSILFCREKDVDREIWDGYRHGPDAARERFGFDEAHSISFLNEKLTELFANQPSIFHAIGYDPEWDARIADALNRVRANARAGVHAPAQMQDVRAMLDDMRLVKDDAEIAVMRHAADIASQAHIRAMRCCRPGQHEFEVEAELLHTFTAHGCRAPAYPSIVASGPNACVLHYVENDRRMLDGELLLIDAGCEVEGYASDITRSFPVNSRFSGPQRDVYQLVLDAQAAALNELRPGAPFIGYHDAAVKVLAQGMLDLGLLSGTLDEVMEKETYRRFYMHRTGHWLGRDVHDAGEYKVRGQWRTLQPGHVLTVEPGCYIRPAPDVPEAYWNIGVRIEDDVLITASGHENLTAACPKRVDEIEAIMAER